MHEGPTIDGIGAQAGPATKEDLVRRARTLAFAIDAKNGWMKQRMTVELLVLLISGSRHGISARIARAVVLGMLEDNMLNTIAKNSPNEV